MFDSQADTAAVVYGANDDPDRLLGAFAEDLRRSGRRVVGLIQTGRRGGFAQEALSAIVLPTGEAVSLPHNRGPLPASCYLDARELAEARARLARAMEDGADLVVINRFGRLEAGGGGFVEEIRQAIVADIPVVIAVPQHLFMAWTRFCAGLGVKLDCSRASLDAWWRTVSRSPRGDLPRSAVTFCEITK